MSYDLYFTAPKISAHQFRDYFANDPRYQMSENQAVYQNDDTGVYFCFEYNDQPPEDDEAVAYFAVFNINLFRPHFFALEAEPEVTRFVERFKFSVDDPQNEESENEIYSPADFLKSWHQSNAAGSRAFLADADASSRTYTRPTQELERIWKWNFLRESRYAIIQKDIFIPKIAFIVADKELYSMCVWTDAIPALIPQVDRILILQNELAPKSLFKKKDYRKCLIPFADALSLLKQYRVDGYEFETFELPSPDTPNEIKDFVRAAKPSKRGYEVVAPDQVLNRELVNKTSTV